MLRPAIALLAAAAASAVPAAPLAATEVGIAATGPVIELSVFENVDIAPDVATISAGVSTQAPTATEAMRQNAAAMQKVVAQIKAQGVADKDIQTTGISLNARYDYDRATEAQVFRGYQATNMVSVMLRQIDRTGAVLDALVAAGATDLVGPSFSLADDTAAKQTARGRAVARAQAQAQAYAAMLGYDGVKVLSITESLAGRGAMQERSKAYGFAETMSADAAPVQPGMIAAGVALSITFALVRGSDSASAGTAP